MRILRLPPPGAAVSLLGCDGANSAEDFQQINKAVNYAEMAFDQMQLHAEQPVDPKASSPPVWRRRPICPRLPPGALAAPRNLERRLSFLEACRGLGSPPQAAPRLRGFACKRQADMKVVNGDSANAALEKVMGMLGGNSASIEQAKAAQLV